MLSFATESYKLFSSHLCIDGWRPLGKNFFDVSATFGRGAVIDPASSKRIPVRGP